MPIIKKSMDKNFTTVHNDFLRDRSLTIEARGLLMTMLSMSDNWNFSIKGLAAILPDGERKVAKVLNELEDKGYLVRVRIYSGGKISDWEYYISDVSGQAAEAAELAGKDREAVTGNVESAAVDIPNVDVRSVDVQNVNVAFGGYKEISEKEKSFDETSIHQSDSAGDMIDEIDYKTAYENAREQIDADILIQVQDVKGNYCYKKSELNELLDIMAWVASTKQPSLKINGEHIDIALVRERFAELDDGHIEYVLDCLKDNPKVIKKRRGYLLTCLYNAPATIDGYYENLVNKYFYGEGN